MDTYTASDRPPMPCTDYAHWCRCLEGGSLVEHHFRGIYFICNIARRILSCKGGVGQIGDIFHCKRCDGGLEDELSWLNPPPICLIGVSLKIPGLSAHPEISPSPRLYISSSRISSGLSSHRPAAHRRRSSEPVLLTSRGSLSSSPHRT